MSRDSMFELPLHLFHTILAYLLDDHEKPSSGYSRALQRMKYSAMRTPRPFEHVTALYQLTLL